MDDRTLLEKAAKAAGYNPIRWTDDGTALLLEGVQQPWNALHKNPHSDCMGDALRLAVKIGEPFVVRTRCVTTMGGLKEDFDPAIRGDDMRATRRIIVRAAAAMAE